MVPVTGGAGFIGSHLVDALLTAGQEPVVLDNIAGGDLKNLPNGVKLVKMDIADAGVEVMVELKPEVVIHAAAQVSVADSMQDPQLDLAVNVQGTANVLEGAKVAGARRVSSSSPRAAGSTASLMALTKPPYRVRRATTARTNTSWSATRS